MGLAIFISAAIPLDEDAREFLNALQNKLKEKGYSIEGEPITGFGSYSIQFKTFKNA